MPKKPGRSFGTSRNFDPSSRYARDSKPSRSKPGSRSQGHRGYRPADEQAQTDRKKPRWTGEQRASRGLNADRHARPSDHDGDRNRDRNRSGRNLGGRDQYSRNRFDDRNENRGERGFGDGYGRRDGYEGRGGQEGRPSKFRPREDSGARHVRGDRYGRSDGEHARFDRNGSIAPRFARGDRDASRELRHPRGFARGERAAYRDRHDGYGDGRDRYRDGQGRGGRGSEREESMSRPASSIYPTKTNNSRTRDMRDDEVLERLQAEATLATDVEGVSFEALGLGSRIARSLETLGAQTPFPIQAATIPDVLSGRDVLGRGRTGSGKTIAFGAPVVELLLRSGSAEIAEGKRTKRAQGRSPRALILAPTRELALQIDRTVQPIARAVGLFTTQVYGGVPQRSQVVALERGVDIVVGTPGRVEDLHSQGRLDLSQVQLTVLDEADHMCELGFLEPVQRILRLTAEGGQRLLFSATLDTGVATLVEEFLTNPAVHEVAGEDQASGTIVHRVFVIDHREKLDIIRALADRDAKTLVFSRTRSYAEDLADALDDEGVPAVSLHGDLNQSRRTRNLEKLTKGRVNVLVATDVAARGIHVDDIDLVIQADAPDEYKTYLHRSGRTGRAGKMGTVVTLVSRGRTRRMRGLLERAEIEAEWSEVTPATAVALLATPADPSGI